MKHILKIWPEFYQEVVNGNETSQIRKDDRNYQNGDELSLMEYMPKEDIYTGRTCTVKVTAVQRKFKGLVSGYCVLSIKLPASSTHYKTELAGKHSNEVENGEVKP